MCMAAIPLLGGGLMALYVPRVVASPRGTGGSEILDVAFASGKPALIEVPGPISDPPEVSA